MNQKVVCIGLLGIYLSACSNGPKADPFEEYSGGDTTVFATGNTAFSQPASNLTADQESDFSVGNSFFENDWVQAPSTTTARDGLGPLFNARACSSCHSRDGRGEPDDSEGDSPGLLLRLSIEGETETGAPMPEPTYGGQLNPASILGIEPEGQFSISYEEVPGSFDDGQTYSLRKPTYTIYNLTRGEIDPDVLVSPRVAQQMIGMGLLEAISEEDILSNADEDDQNGDGISGRANYVYEIISGQSILGRFGWKANQPSVEQQVAGAFLGDIGITSSLFPNENCASSDSDCLDAETGGSSEIEDDILSLVVFYAKTLAVPARRDWADEEVLFGKELFNQANCSSCHIPQLTTSSTYSIAQLAGQTIRPYTDLLLHDMGDELADGRPDFEASGNEWRTPPLWGIGLIESVNGHTFFLHDGRARNLSEAILWHGGEAEASREAYRNMTEEERTALIRFLKSL